MVRRAIALLSGGLDSMLAVRTVQAQDVEVVGLHFRTPFTTLDELATQAAADLQIPLAFADAGEDYLQLLAQPRFGRCQVAAPCLDCRQMQLERAARALEEHDAQFVITGEVLGQRRWGQRRRDFEAIPQRAGLADRVVRPLSARLLGDTLPERLGWLNRELLHEIQGKARRRQLQLAAEYRFARVPPPLAHCCLLAVERVGGRLLRAVADGTELTRIDCELMALGEHVRATAACAAVLSRNAAEGEALRALHRRHGGARLGILEPTSFTGPLAILRGTIDTESTAAAAVLISDRARANSPSPREFRLTRGGGAEPFSL